MRSLVLCPYVPDVPDHGGRIRSRVLIRALQRLGPVTVVVPREAGVEPRAARLAQETGVVVETVATGNGRPSALGKLASWAAGRSELFGRRWHREATAELRRLLANDIADLVVVDSSHTIPLLPDDCDLPVVVHYHNVESALLAREDHVARPWAERFARKRESVLVARLEAAAALRALVSITTSMLDRDRLVALASGARVEAVENSVDLEARPMLPPAELSPPRLLFVGSLDYPPNREAAEELLREHLPALRGAHPDLQLQIVGRDDGGAVTRLAADCGAEAVGRVDDLIPHYRAAAAVYLPIRSGGGTRIKVIEAFAVGRPVLATAVAVEGLDVLPGEHYLRVETPSHGAEALQKVLSGGAVDMVRRARELTEQRWSHDTAESRIADLIAEAFARR